MPEFTCFAYKRENEVSDFMPPPEAKWVRVVPLPSECPECARHSQDHIKTPQCAKPGARGVSLGSQSVTLGGFWQPVVTTMTLPCRPQVCLSEKDESWPWAEGRILNGRQPPPGSFTFPSDFPRRRGFIVGFAITVFLRQLYTSKAEEPRVVLCTWM